MSEFWEKLQGTTLDGRFRLEKLVQAAKDQAEYVSGDATVTVMEAGSDSDEQLGAMKDACQLQHPNLLRLLGAGRTTQDGLDLLYLAAEKPERTLEEVKLLSPDQRRLLERSITFALAYLHQKGLAYNNLVPATVVEARGSWKLADYGSMTPLTPERERVDQAAMAALLASPNLQEAPVLMAPAPEPPDRPKFNPRLLPNLALGGAVVATLMLAVWASSRPSSQPKEPPRLAATQAVSSERPSPIPNAPATKPVVSTPPVKTAKVAPPSPVPASTHATPPATSVPQQSKPAGGSSETGKASFFSPDMNGHQTASGERVNSEDFTAAHRSQPLGSKLRVTNVKNGKSVIVRVNDRGAFGRGQSLIVSPRVARELGFLDAGSATVHVEPVR